MPDQECHSPRGKVRPRSREPEQGLATGRRVAGGRGRSVYLRPTVASGAVVVSAGRDLDLDYGIFGLTLSDEEGQG